jgi:hypothetical protein
MTAHTGLVATVYVSQAAVAFSSAALGELAERAAAHNATIGVTGVLLYSGGHFIQLLEGPPLEVTRLYNRIAADHRHAHVRRVAFGLVAKRAFPGWHMGVLDVDSSQHLDRAALTDAFEEVAGGPVDIRHAVALLDRFAKLLPRPQGR